MMQMLADIRPNEEHAKDHIQRNPVTTVTQVVQEMSEHEVRFSLSWAAAMHWVLHPFVCDHDDAD